MCSIFLIKPQRQTTVVFRGGLRHVQHVRPNRGFHTSGAPHMQKLLSSLIATIAKQLGTN